MGMKHHSICCIKIGLRGASMRKTSLLAVVKEGKEGCTNPPPLLQFIPIMPCLQQLQSRNKGREWGKRRGGKGYLKVKG